MSMALAKAVVVLRRKLVTESVRRRETHREALLNMAKVCRHWKHCILSGEVTGGKNVVPVKSPTVSNFI
jgi:hypothetical protein